MDVTTYTAPNQSKNMFVNWTSNRICTSTYISDLKPMFYLKDKNMEPCALHYFDINMIHTVTKILQAMWELCWWKTYGFRFWGHVNEKHELLNMNKFKTK